MKKISYTPSIFYVQSNVNVIAYFISCIKYIFLFFFKSGIGLGCSRCANLGGSVISHMYSVSVFDTTRCEDGVPWYIGLEPIKIVLYSWL